VRPATTRQVVPVRGIRLGEHPTYDRIVFDLAGTGVPAVHLEEVTPPLRADPSDLALDVAGRSFVRIVLVGATGLGTATGGPATYTGPAAFRPTYPRLVELVRRGDYEAYFSWYAGLSGGACYRVSVMTAPTRLIVDLAAAT
jgi:hypothetical protein